MSIIVSCVPRAAVRAVPRPRADIAVPVLLTGTGLLLWAVSLGRIDLARMNDHGLLPALPITWFAGVALLLGAAAAAFCQRRARPALIALATAALVVALYGTVPAVSDVPQYFWAYKHIGVTRYIEMHGSVSPDIDIYHRWPGFFAVSAAFSWLAGRGSPVEYAGWAEVFFLLVCTAAVAALGRRLLGDARLGQLAGLLFVLTNWVGQSYFAPQAFAFTLTLGIFILVVDHFTEPRENRVNRVVLRVAGALVHRRLALAPFAATDVAAGRRTPPRATVVTLVVLLQAAVVASHQLTPYMLVLGVAALTVLGMVRPWWLVVALAVVAVAYLLPNLDYVQGSFGLFSGMDPIANVRTQGPFTPDPMPGKNLNGLAGQLLCIAVWLLAALGAVRWARGPAAAPTVTAPTVTAPAVAAPAGARPLGDGRALVPVVLVLAAGGLIIGQNYGGEGILRVVLFSLPWSAILAARALAPGPGHRWRPRRALSVLPVLGVLAALFMPAFHGQAAMNILPADEVHAAEHLYDAATPGAAIVTATPDFPVKLTGGYDRFGPAEQNVPALLDHAELRRRPLGRPDVDTVEAVLDGYGPESYLVFATSQETYADIYRIAPPRALRSLEAALEDSGRFSLWYSTANTRIYRYRSAGPST
ncbi:hypothetical protein CC117_06305 [Parafrankia colletiae]|uniref:Glycosyltransferase RgtA/B/C/D-like domain-containing protein n=1 Tax=Parafrankia colletiae TaxID=573497 RepID=A0A1S1QBT5_9ACTN|nr:hypothetical protein [Parafrankia colletiae]MCK9901046.1 hypothetical protein [Frankia sp. Cpl3]OHV30552.1 hypothetical protein CC117_06305 [Parafrankia colletiae]